MFIKKSKKDKIFVLPEKDFFIESGTIDPHKEGKSDPLMYYYRPIIGKIYRQRIQCGLNLLTGNYETVLDFGYGSGLLFPTLEKFCTKLIGVDIESDPSEVSKRLNNIQIKADLYNKNLLEINNLDNSIDLIVAFSVFEHIKSPDIILERMKKMLKPNGELLVGMPRVDRAMSKMFSLIGYNEIDDHHVTNYKEFMSVATKYFELKKNKRIPAILPAFAGLYFNMLFKKRC